MRYNKVDLDKYPTRKHPINGEMISMLGRLANEKPLTRNDIVEMIKKGHPNESVKQHLERIDALWRAARALCWDGYADMTHEGGVLTVRINEDGHKLWAQILEEGHIEA